MTIIEEKSVTRYLLSRRFLAFLAVCFFLGAGLGYLYYISEATEPITDETSVSPHGDNATNSPPASNESPKEIASWETNEEINIFRDYLRIPTDHPNIDYEPCVEFLKDQAKKAELPVSVYYPANDENPIVVMTWLGSQPELPSIMLNSHMDVVPAFDEYWTHPPFAAEMDEQGNIFARGAQDAKCIGMQYLAAIRALKKEGVKQFKRTIHVVFVPDEEMGSHFGMYAFVDTNPFRAMNVGFVLDEGSTSEENEPLDLFFAERATRRMEFVFHGKSGHGSIMVQNTAAEKLFYIIKKFSELRQIETEKGGQLLEVDRNLTSINLTVIKGGLEGNVVPPKMSAIFDVRLAVDADHDAFDEMIHRWCEEAGGNITINYIIKDPKSGPTAVDDSNPFWTAIKNATDELNLKIAPVIVGGATDSRFIRPMGIPAFGFSPMINTTLLAHDNDENLNAKVYLYGIEVYKTIIPNIANV